jgi:Tfp pilus assembly protein PilF
LAGEYQEAADYLAKVSEGDANYKECLVYLASAYMKMGEEEIAAGVREAFRGEEDLEELYRELLENR